MPRYFIEVAYKGTRYAGFQIQQNANSVQAEVEQALRIFYREAIKLTGSSRTDAGVHALQNFFHFDAAAEVQEACYHLNAILPNDIVIRGMQQVPDELHCRFSALSREYEYFIYRQKDPFLEDRAYFYPFPLSMEVLHAAAAELFNHSDFTSFSKRNTQTKTKLCNVMTSQWRQEDGTLVFTVRANRFLRGMVRGLVATMLQAGRGKITLDEFRDIITAKDCTRADFSAPPQGLFLKRVLFS